MYGSPWDGGASNAMKSSLATEGIGGPSLVGADGSISGAGLDPKMAMMMSQLLGSGSKAPMQAEMPLGEDEGMRSNDEWQKLLQWWSGQQGR